MNFFNYILTFLLLLGITNAKAQFIFDKALGTDGTDQARDVLFTQDNNYLVFGFSWGGSVGNDGIYLAKIDTSGTILWEKWHLSNGLTGSNGVAWNANTICETIDSGFVIGSKNDTGNKDIGFLIKFNAQGDTLFSKSDSINLGKDVLKVMQAPDGNLLVLVTIVGGRALVKLDNNFNLIAKIDTITSSLGGIKVVNNKIYILKQDSIDNLWIIDNDMLIIDTVTVPIKYPKAIRTNYSKNQLVFYGRDSIGLYTSHKMIYTDLLGNIDTLCDMISILYNIDISDFKPTLNNNEWIFMGLNYDIQWGKDIKLYFTDNCGNILYDTTLARWSFTIQPLDEVGVKILVDNEGNYLLFGNAQFGVLGGNDIFLVKYKKWDFPTSIDSTNKEDPSVNPDFTIFPNPTQNYFTIIGLQENTTVTIWDARGKIIYSTTVNTTSVNIAANHWAKGMYIIQIKNNEEYITHKIIKQ